jgi:hypothetical protein
LVGVSVCLIFLVLGSFVYWIIIEKQSTTRLEPSNLYFFNPSYSVGNETFMKVWNSTKNLEEISDLSRLGNYSVLIYWYYYAMGLVGAPEYLSEWFVVASTLQSDKNGFIHQVFLRLSFENFTLIASYEQAFNYSPTPFVNGTQTIQDFLSRDPILYGVQEIQQEFYTNYPFLILVVKPMDFGITIILNQETGKIMMAATLVWIGMGHLVYPETIFFPYH